MLKRKTEIIEVNFITVKAGNEILTVHLVVTQPWFIANLEI